MPLKYAFAILFLCFMLFASAQDGDVEIRVRRASPIYLSPDPDTTVVINYVMSTFTLRGMPAGSLVNASFSSGMIEVKDSFVYIKALCQFPGDTGTKELNLKLHITTKSGKHISTIEKTILVMPPIKKANMTAPLLPSLPTYSIIYGIVRRSNIRTISNTETRIWRNQINPDVEKDLRKRAEVYFLYTDSSFTQRQYRAVDMVMEIGGVAKTYHNSGNKMAPEAYKIIKKQKGKTSFKLLLYKQFIRGDGTRRVFIDTLSYQAPGSVTADADPLFSPLGYIPAIPYICSALYQYDYQERRRDRPGDVLATLVCTKPNGTAQTDEGAKSCYRLTR